jgi:hypothetical protein
LSSKSHRDPKGGSRILKGGFLFFGDKDGKVEKVTLNLSLVDRLAWRFLPSSEKVSPLYITRTFLSMIQESGVKR